MNCVVCKQRLRPGDKSCGMCGAPVTSSDRAAAPTALAPPRMPSGDWSTIRDAMSDAPPAITTVVDASRSGRARAIRAIVVIALLLVIGVAAFLLRQPR